MSEHPNLRMRLMENHLSYAWLIAMMRLKGVEVDKSTISSAVNGTITGDRVTKIIDLAHTILDEYERIWLGHMKGK